MVGGSLVKLKVANGFSVFGSLPKWVLRWLTCQWMHPPYPPKWITKRKLSALIYDLIKVLNYMGVCDFLVANINYRKEGFVLAENLIRKLSTK